MRIPKVVLLSWLVDLVCYGFVTCIVSYCAFVYIDLVALQSFAELPPAEIYALARSMLTKGPLPESWRGPYTYMPSTKWIRLCKIVHGDDAYEGLAFTFHKFLLDAAPPYRALSYTWGPAHGGTVGGDGAQINWVVHGRNRSLPANLVWAVLELRDRNLSEYYWIDAICINQLEHKERSEQVNNMDKIFQRATAVDVWLGRSWQDTHKVNDLARDLVLLHQEEQKLSPEEVLRGRPTWTRGEEIMQSRDWLTIVHILSRRWFHRVWTIQEFALAKEVTVICGNITIDLKQLHEASQFLSDHRIPMPLAYGNEKRSTSATILQLDLLQKAVYGQEPIELDFLECFHDFSSASSIEYETVLVWVYWRSMANFASDPRDYVFGITGVANAIASRLGLNYEPFGADYSLTTGEAFQAFIVRIINSSYGIRAIALIRHNVDFVVRHPTDVKTEGLPSWVPDLANRDWFGLSTNGGLKSLSHDLSCQNILGTGHAALVRQSAWVNGSALHLKAHRTGKIVKSSYTFPIEVKQGHCGSFVLSLVALLAQLPGNYPGTNQTPIEALLHTLRLDGDVYAGPYAPKTFNTTDFERFLAQALQLFMWQEARPPKSQSYAQTLSWLIHQAGIDPWSIQGLTWGLATPELMLQSSEDIGEDGGEVKNALIASCNTFHRAFGPRIAVSKLFLLQLHDDNQNMPAQFQQKPPTGTLLLGLGPDSLGTNAEVWVAAGAEWPFIFSSYVQEDTDGVRGSFARPLDLFSFHGEAYVHGIMHGELFETSEPKWQEVVLK